MALTPFHRFQYNLVLRFIGMRDIPLIATAGVRIVQTDEDRCTNCVPMKRRNKNHLGSMYFGALAIGADAAAGLVAVLENRRHGNGLNFVFKDFHADFLKRPEGDTHQPRHVVSALGHVEDLDQRAEELLEADLAAQDAFAEVQRRGVAVDQGAVEVEEGADFRTLRTRGDRGQEIVDVCHGSILPNSRRTRRGCRSQGQRTHHAHGIDGRGEFVR